MSATRTSAKKHVDRGHEKPAAAPVQTFEPKPCKPRRGLFLLLAAVMLIWIAVLIVMYVKTVHNARPAPLNEREMDIIQSDKLLDEPNPATRPGASDLPSAPR